MQKLEKIIKIIGEILLVGLALLPPLIALGLASYFDSIDDDTARILFYMMSHE